MAHKWRYRFFKINVRADELEIEKVLNKHGSLGWELVAVADCPIVDVAPAIHWQTLFFRRPK